MSRRDRSRRRGANDASDAHPREGDLARWIAAYLSERAEMFFGPEPDMPCEACGRRNSRRAYATQAARWFHGRHHGRDAHVLGAHEDGEDVHHGPHRHGDRWRRHGRGGPEREASTGHDARTRAAVGVPWPLLFRLVGLGLLALAARSRARGRARGRRGFSV